MVIFLLLAMINSKAAQIALAAALARRVVNAMNGPLACKPQREFDEQPIPGLHSAAAPKTTFKAKRTAPTTRAGTKVDAETAEG
jgi:hypothetical protein